MKKKFTLNIKTPCSENFSAMIPNEHGSFCSLCAKNVIDLSSKTHSEVAQFIAQNKDQSICARLRTSQLEEEFEYNPVPKTTQLKYAVAVAASVLLTSNVVAQENNPTKVETCEVKPVRHLQGKVAYSNVPQVVAYTIKGTVLEKGTKKPFPEKQFPNLTISIGGKSATVNPKTGEYSIPILMDKKAKEMEVTLISGDYHYSKTFPVNFKSAGNKKNLILNLLISEKEMRLYMIAGGLGVNYIPEKK